MEIKLTKDQYQAFERIADLCETDVEEIITIVFCEKYGKTNEKIAWTWD